MTGADGEQIVKILLVLNRTKFGNVGRAVDL
jgi:hypothetical protein